MNKTLSIKDIVKVAVKYLRKKGIKTTPKQFFAAGFRGDLSHVFNTYYQAIEEDRKVYDEAPMPKLIDGDLIGYGGRIWMASGGRIVPYFKKEKTVAEQISAEAYRRVIADYPELFSPMCTTFSPQIWKRYCLDVLIEYVDSLEDYSPAETEKAKD